MVYLGFGCVRNESRLVYKLYSVEKFEDLFVVLESLGLCSFGAVEVAGGWIAGTFSSLLFMTNGTF